MRFTDSLSRLSIISFCSAFLAVSCSDTEPATPEESAMMRTMVDSARQVFERSKPFRRYNVESIPSPTSSADVYRSSETELRLVDSGIAATLSGSAAEILFSISGTIDSTSSHPLEAFVFLTKTDSGWNGNGAYVRERDK